MAWRLGMPDLEDIVERIRGGKTIQNEKTWPTQRREGSIHWQERDKRSWVLLSSEAWVAKLPARQQGLWREAETPCGGSAPLDQWAESLDTENSFLCLHGQCCPKTWAASPCPWFSSPQGPRLALLLFCLFHPSPLPEGLARLKGVHSQRPLQLPHPRPPCAVMLYTWIPDFPSQMVSGPC